MKWLHKNQVFLLLAIVILLAFDILIQFESNLYTPYVGVLIGATLGWIGSLFQSWISTNSENQKRKLQIKYELIAAAHLYYQYIKAQIINLNQRDFVSKRYEIYKNNQVDSETVNFNKSLLDEYLKSFEKIYHLMNEQEAKLCSLKYEVVDHYKQQINIEQLSLLIDNVINNGNNFDTKNRLKNYTNIKTVEQINEIGLSINEIVLTKELEIFNEGENFKKNIIGILK